MKTVQIVVDEKLQKKWLSCCKRIGKNWGLNQSQIGRLALEYYMENNIDARAPKSTG